MSKLSITLDKEKNTEPRPIVQSNDSLDKAPRNRAPEIAPATAWVSISVSLCPCGKGADAAAITAVHRRCILVFQNKKTEDFREKKDGVGATVRLPF